MFESANDNVVFASGSTPTQVWFPHADKRMTLKEMKVLSDQYDCVFTILKLPRSETVWPPWEKRDKLAGIMRLTDTRGGSAK